jgi:hypothetical protein
MNKFEQRFAVKFLFIKGLRSKAIHTGLAATLGATLYSLTQVQEWVRRLKTGDSSCQNDFRAGGPSSDLAEPLYNLLKSFILHPARFSHGS